MCAGDVALNVDAKHERAEHDDFYEWYGHDAALLADDDRVHANVLHGCYDVLRYDDARCDGGAMYDALCNALHDMLLADEWRSGYEMPLANAGI